MLSLESGCFLKDRSAFHFVRMFRQVGFEKLLLVALGFLSFMLFMHLLLGLLLPFRLWIFVAHDLVD